MIHDRIVHKFENACYTYKNLTLDVAVFELSLLTVFGNRNLVMATTLRYISLQMSC